MTKELIGAFGCTPHLSLQEESLKEVFFWVVCHMVLLFLMTKLMEGY